MIGVVKKFQSLDGISARFGRGTGSDYTHCILIIAQSDQSLKTYLHDDHRLIDWMRCVRVLHQRIRRLRFAKNSPLHRRHRTFTRR